MNNSPLKKLLAAMMAVAISAAPAAAQFLYTSGHADIGFGELAVIEPHLHLHAGAVVNGTPLVGDTEFEPGEVTTVVGKSGYDFIASAGGRPAGSAWDPIGIGAGNSFWFLPQAAAGPGGATALGLPLLGLGAEEVTLGAFDGNLMKITLVGAVMPTGGNFSMWTTDFGGNPTFAMSTYDGISAADMKLLDIGVSDHEHVNWGFTEAGLYELTFEFSALEGGILVSETATYTFAAIPEPSHYAAVLAAGTLAVFGIQRRMRLRLA